MEKESLRINVILAEEADAATLSGPLHWAVLTTEAVNTAEAALQVVRCHELRWRIEDYHKAWKSGVGVERQRFQGARKPGTDTGHRRIPGGAPVATEGTAGQTRGYGWNNLWGGVGRRRMESPAGFDRT